MRGIAQGLMCRPKLLMVDELSLGLSPLIVASILEAVRELNRSGISVVLVEQSVNVSTTIAERALFMEKGDVRFSGSTSELQNTDLLRSVFVGTDRHEGGSGLERVAARRDLRRQRNGADGRQYVSLQATGIDK